MARLETHSLNTTQSHSTHSASTHTEQTNTQHHTHIASPHILLAQAATTPSKSPTPIRLDFIDYCLFITFFPQLIAGPIVHHSEMMPQFHAMGDAIQHHKDTRSKNVESTLLDSNVATTHTTIQTAPTTQTAHHISTQTLQTHHQASNQAIPYTHITTQAADTQIIHQTQAQAQAQAQAQTRTQKTSFVFHWEYIAKGLFIFSIGLFKKVAIADSFAKWAENGSKSIQEGIALNLLESWVTALSHMFEYYFDFSGYCDMAIGLGLLFGIIIPINFNSPFKSLSISEFWRRWHITLGRFLKHYVYIPLGGSRVPLIFNLRNLFIVFFISGIWHGAGFGFIIWGSIHGLSVVIHKLYTLFYKRLHPNALYLRFMKTKLYVVLCWSLTFLVVLLARVFYVSPSIKDAIALLKGMFLGSLVLPKSLESRLGFLGDYVEFGAVWLGNINGSFMVFLWILGTFMLCLLCKNSAELTDSLSKRFAKTKLALAGLLFMCALCIQLEHIYANHTPQFLYFNF